jgi:hypothetical protein
MNKFLKPVIKLVPTFQYLNIFWNLNTEVDTCVQFKYLSTRPCNYTYYIVHSTDYVLSLRKYYNLFVYLFVSWSGNITTSLMVPLDVLCLWCWVYLIHFLCCFTQSNDILYIWLTLPPSPFLVVSMCVFFILQYWSLITKSLYSDPTDIYLMHYRLIIYMLSFLICHYI